MSDKLSKFMPIWEIETHFKCPVIGAVVSVEKHRQILKKCGYNVRNMKPYEYHQQLMSKLFEENNVSIKVNNYLRSRARKSMLTVHGKTDKEIRQLWKKQSAMGNVGPLMYAIVSYEETGVELLQDVYGEVHMQAHANMTQIFDIRKKLAAADESVQREKKKIGRKKVEIQELARTNKTLLKRNRELEQEYIEMRGRFNDIESKLSPDHFLAEENSRLKGTIVQLETGLERQNETIRIKEREKRSLQIELFSLKQEKELVEEQMQALIDGISALNVMEPSDACSCCEDGCTGENCRKELCPQYQLCAKRVFMVGGITKMKSYYRDIVEKAGGKFDYHDGYLKQSSANLEARVKRSDLVICPVNCNSHNACLRVKKLCTRYNKQLKILSSSSLSAITHALFSQEHETILN